MSEQAGTMRWDPYILAQGAEFDRFWAEHLAARDRKVAIVAGLGFDARACVASQRILNASQGGQRDLWLICYDNAQANIEELKPLVDANDTAFASTFQGRGNIHRLPLQMRRENGRIASGPATQKLIPSLSGLFGYDDIVIDISAMPRMIALVLISQLIALLDKRRAAGTPVPNLHVVVAESVAMDVDVAEESLEEDVVHVTGFTGRIGAESINNPKIWFPILGEGQRIRLQRIYEKLQPDEICPVIPFPSINPRRGDALIEEYRDILFEDYRVDPRSILYASEFNPFEAYRHVFGAIDRYRLALGELDSCRAIVSPLSSKLLSVGAILAAYDHRTQRSGQFHIGLHYVEAGSYRPPATANGGAHELIGMWIVGEWEEA